MSLVTRCPTCATTFKVVRDQLRISDGWVRCGRCSEIFDATQDLRDAVTGEQLAAQSFAFAPAAVTAPADAAPSSAGADFQTPARPSEAVNRSTPPSDASQGDGHWDGAAGTNAAHRAADDPRVAPQAQAGDWPSADLLEIPSFARASDAAATHAQLPPAPQPTRRDDGEPAQPVPAGVPAWRRIQVPSLANIEGVLTDKPWPMRRASDADPQDGGSQAPAAAAIDAAVDVQLKKALRRARAEAWSQDLARERLEVEMTPQDKLRDAARDMAAPAELDSAAAGVLRPVSDKDQLSQTEAVSVEVPAADAEPGPHAPPMQIAPTSAQADDLVFSEPAELSESEDKPKRRLGALWALLSLLALALLAAQWLRHERDGLAASQPALRPAISKLCELTQCFVGPPRRIDAVRIDGSSFTPSGQGERYALAFTLRNAAPTSVAMPSIELTLLDGNERAVVRRIFHPADFRAPAQMNARGQQSGQLLLALQAPSEARAPAVVGYSLLAFYP